MIKLGIIGGSSVLNLDAVKDFSNKTVRTEFGIVELMQQNDVCFLQRHGFEYKTPPHKINHKANISALASQKVDKIIGISSTGSLKISLKPGMFIVPHDYINLLMIPTFYDDKCMHTVPGFDDKTRHEICSVLEKLVLEFTDAAVYFQTTGPRFETKAEVKLIAQFADVVSMTAASEATLARELDIPYALLCTVDNYANGLIEKPLEVRQIKATIAKNKENLSKIITGLISLYKDRR